MGRNGTVQVGISAAPRRPELLALPRYILFEGRHAAEADCVALYDRFYSPIGMCRLLATKSGKSAFLYTFVWLDVVFAI
jgi:hypothetical protein